MTKAVPRTYSEHARADDGSLCFYLYREMRDPEVIARFTVDGEPVSKQRPRFTKGPDGNRVYTPKATTAAERDVAWLFRQAAGPQRLDPSQGFGVYIGFFCGTGQRQDVDNMSKLVLDGLNGVAWVDDSQVTELSAKISRWDANPRTEIVIYRTVLQLHPYQTCEQCGRNFPMYRSSKPRRWCSQECRRIATSVELTCPQCSKQFRIKAFRIKADPVADGQRHCSRACLRAAQAARLVHLICEGCEKAFTLRPSEHAERPGRKFCTAACRRRASGS